MSGFSAKKISNLESLDPREQAVLLFIMRDQDIKITDIANLIHLGESTTRNILTGVYTKLGVPENERDKRGWLHQEYLEIYRERYLRITKMSEGSIEDNRYRQVRAKPIDDDIVVEGSYREERPRGDPGISVSPSESKPRQSVVTGGLLGGFLIISLIAVGLLVTLINVLNRPTAPVVMAAETQAPVVVYQDPPAQEAIVPTQTPYVIPTNTPAPPAPMPPTPIQKKDIYVQGELAPLRDGVTASLKTRFGNTNFVGCFLEATHTAGFNIIIDIKNESSQEFLIRFERTSLSAVDDTGKIYQLWRSGAYNCTEGPGLESYNLKNGREVGIVAGFFGEIPINAK